MRRRFLANRPAALVFPILAVCLVAAACGNSLEDTRDVPAGIPWAGVGSETSTYAITGPDGSQVAQGTLTIEERGAQTAFIQQYLNDAGTDNVEVLVDATTLRPAKTIRTIRTDTLNRDVLAEYGAELVHVVISGDESADEEIEFPAHAYDTEESLFLWRTLPFAVGYEVKYVTINPNRPTGRVGSVRVVAIENVTVPAGTFEVWRVEATAASSKVVAWYDTQGTHRLVQYDSGDFEYALQP